MKKRTFTQLFLLIFIMQLLFFNIIPVNATTYGRISSIDGLRLRNGPGTSKYSKLDIIPHNTIVTILP